MKLRELFDQELDELIGVKKYRHLTARQIMKKMEDELGLKKLGSGAFGDVIQSPDPNWVYKVIEVDPAYEDFLEFIKAEPNTHYPIIKRTKTMTSFFKRYQIQENKFKVIVIEKLYPLPEDNKLWFLLQLINASDLDDIPNFTPDLEDNTRTFKELMKYTWKGWKPGEMLSVWQAADDLHGLTADFGVFRDLHGSNVMQRLDGTIVLIDPIAGQEGLDYIKAVDTAKVAHDTMVKGPHYKLEPAQPSATDDPYDDANLYPSTLQTDQGRGQTDKAMDELEDLMSIPNPTRNQVARMNILHSFIAKR